MDLKENSEDNIKMKNHIVLQKYTTCNQKTFTYGVLDYFSLNLTLLSIIYHFMLRTSPYLNFILASAAANVCVGLFLRKKAGETFYFFQKKK